MTPQWFDHSPATTIDDAIASYAARTDGVGSAPPYDAASLAEIYGPRVRDLIKFREQGFTRARWGHDLDTKTNRWFPIPEGEL